MSEWFENEVFWKETFPFMFPESLFTETDDQMDRLLALTDFKGDSVLDLCCGPGRCAIAMAGKGYAVTGVDLSPYLLEKAKARATAQGVFIEWIQDDMRCFKRPAAFDLVLNMFTSFGYFNDKDEDVKVLQNMFTSLKPGGVLVIDTMSKECLAKIYQPTMSQTLEDGSLLVQRPQIYDDWTRVKNDWTIIRGERARTFSFHHTIYSGQELKDRMAQVGFKDIALYGNLNGDAYDTDAQRLVIVGRKQNG